MPRSSAERLAVFRRCARRLSGHGVPTARSALLAAAEEAADGERGDVYGAGELVEAFERDLATLLGKPACVFMPSGTMAQQIALRIWSDRRGRKTVAFHPTSHLELHEQRAYEHLHGLHARLVGDPHRLFTRADLDRVAEPVAALLVELPQREIGGQLPPWDDLVAQTEWARQRGAAVHLDGARLWETQPFYARPYAAIAALFDSVYVSFYKVLDGIAGAALAGPEDFIAEARVWQRRHGGNLVTQHPFVLAARRGLRERLPRVPAYVRRAAEVARVLGAIPGVRVVPDPPHTNMMHVALPAPRPGGDEALLDASADVAHDEGICLFGSVRPCDVPGFAVVELHAGEAAFAIKDEEIDRLFRRVLEVAAESGRG